MNGISLFLTAFVYFGAIGSAHAAQSVASLSLVDATNSEVLGTVTNGETINLSALPTSSLSILANTSPTPVGSVTFVLDGNSHTENMVPYSACGKANPDYIACSELAMTGKHTLVVTPYSGSNGSGTAGTKLSISFTISKNSSTPPSVPTNLTLTHQGEDSGSLQWTASTGTVSEYIIYRSDNLDPTPVQVGTTPGTTTFTDNTATNTIIFAGYDAASGPTTKSYSYSVEAKNSAGTSSLATDIVAWFFHGIYYGGDPLSSTKDYNYSPCGSMTADYTDTSGSPQYGAYDVKISAPCVGAIWQPFSGGTFLEPISGTDDLYAMDVGAFKYLTIDLKAAQDGQIWTADIVSRVPDAAHHYDAFNTAGVKITSASGTANKWETYKIPLQGSNSLQVGRGKFSGYIKNGSLVVTALDSGISIQGGSWISGTGIPAGTYILSTDTGDGGPGTSGPGTYPIAGPGINSGTNVSATTITIDRTNFYKFTLQDVNSTGDHSYYIDNVGFTNY